MRPLNGVDGAFLSAIQARGQTSAGRAHPLAPSPQLSPTIPLAAGQPTAMRRHAAKSNRALSAAPMAASLFIGAAVIYGIAIGGYARHFAEGVEGGARTAMLYAGLTVKNLEIAGRDKTSREDIVQALGFDEGAPILSVDGAAAKQNLEKLSWVRHSKVLRFLPSTVQVVIEERLPFAVWQLNGKMHLIDVEGREITAVEREDYAKLPLVVGKGAPGEANKLFAMLEKHADLSARVMAAVWVGERRWTLKLNNGVEIKLPEERIAGAFDRLIELEQARGVLSADVKSIDLRLGDRISVRLSEETSAKRDKLAKDAAKRDGQATAKGT